MHNITGYKTEKTAFDIRETETTEDGTDGGNSSDWLQSTHPPEDIWQALRTYLPEVLHAVHVVVQQVSFRDADPLELGKVGHARPLVVGDPPPLVREVEAVRILALDERKPASSVSRTGIALGR